MKYVVQFRYIVCTQIIKAVGTILGLWGQKIFCAASLRKIYFNQTFFQKDTIL